jgi:hypothetical protein
MNAREAFETESRKVHRQYQPPRPHSVSIHCERDPEGTLTARGNPSDGPLLDSRVARLPRTRAMRTPMD